MRSRWKVTSNPIGGKTVYGAYRLIDMDKVEHSGNRELYDNRYFNTDEEAQEIVDRLNSEEES